MNHFKMEPEYILAESEKIHLTANQLVNLNQRLLDMEVDLVVLLKEHSKLDAMSTRIVTHLREVRSSLELDL